MVALAHCLSTGANAALQQQSVVRLLSPLDTSLAALVSLYQGAGVSFCSVFRPEPCFAD